MKETTFELKIEEGAQQIRVTLTDKSVDPSQATAIESPIFFGTEDKRMALRCLGSNLGYIIRKRAWPNDTEIYDTVVGPHGTKLCNPHFPHV